ncbi:hypothetical protein J6590_066219 [Homalodisca vitripennis]|nr:hypothetical protein J6590_066219 [Homalodisca vitripennis]
MDMGIKGVQYATQTVAVKRLNSTQNPILAGVTLSKNFSPERPQHLPFLDKESPENMHGNVSRLSVGCLYLNIYSPLKVNHAFHHYGFEN